MSHNEQITVVIATENNKHIKTDFFFSCFLEAPLAFSLVIFSLKLLWKTKSLNALQIKEN